MESYNKVKGIHLANRYNNRVFITPPWKEIYRNDRERDQTFEQSIEVYKRLEKWYGEHGYEMVVLPKDTVENRAKFILSQVGAKT
jgi:predicted ATPase